MRRVLLLALAALIVSPLPDQKAMVHERPRLLNRADTNDAAAYM